MILPACTLTSKTARYKVDVIFSLMAVFKMVVFIDLDNEGSLANCDVNKRKKKV